MNTVDTATMLAAFVEEARDLLDGVEPDFAALAGGPPSPEQIQRAMRAVHTIKGNCGFVGMLRLEGLAHDAESLLVAFGKGGPADPEKVGHLMRMLDAMRRMLDRVERDGKDDSRGDANPLPPEADELAGSAPATAMTPRVHVDAKVLDDLTRVAGELAHLRGMLADREGLEAAPQAGTLGLKLDRLSHALQRIVVEARTEPVTHLWRGAPRLVHDLARGCGKEAVVRLEGGETGLDRSLVELLRKPLVHLLRNAVVHGIELPQARCAAGKSAVGTVTLRARQRDGLVRIEVADDGAGISPDRLRREAVARNLLTADQAAAATDSALLDLVFRPGFSTAAQVSSASGRGVGLDAVRAAAERVGGTVTMTTVPGGGTTFRLTLPCALAIRRVIRLESGGHVYALPIQDVAEMIRLGESGVTVGDVGGAPVLRRRDTVLPLVSLARLLGTPEAPAAELAVIRTGAGSFALSVDALLDVREIVVTPFTRRLEGATVFAGAALEGDGAVTLLLDVTRLARLAGVTAGDAPLKASDEGATARVGATWVVFRAPDGARRAVPVSAVARLETITPAAVTRAGGRTMAVSRDLPLDLVGWPDVPPDPTATLRIIVCTDRDRMIGVVADRILEIGDLDESTALTDPAGGGVTVVVDAGEITELIDPAALFGTPRFAAARVG